MLSCQTPVVLPPIGPPARASVQAVEPVYKSKRRRKPKSLEDLGRYTATSGCYELIDELMQSVLLERPAAVLPHLVQHCREKTALSEEDRAQLEHKFEQGKLLSAEEMDALRNGSAQPLAAEAFRLLSRPLPDTHTGHRHRVGPLGAAARRRGFQNYVSSQQINVLLQAMMLELLQTQPASPLAFAMSWLEHRMELQLAAARAAAVEAKMELAEARQAHPTTEGEAALSGAAEAAVWATAEAKVVEVDIKVDIVMKPAKTVGVGDGGDEELSNVASAERPERRRMRSGEIHSSKHGEQADAIEVKLRLGHMLTEEEAEELRRRAVEQEEGEGEDLERKMELGYMLSEEEVEELRRRAQEAEMEEQKCKHEIEQKLAEGHMLTEREAQMLARFAEEQGQEAEGM